MRVQVPIKLVGFRIEHVEPVGFGLRNCAYRPV